MFGSGATRTVLVENHSCKVRGWTRECSPDMCGHTFLIQTCVRWLKIEICLTPLGTGKPRVICQDTSHKATLPGQARRPCLSEEWPVTGETHTICARSLLGESEDDAGGTVPRPITRPADHRRQGLAHGSGRVDGRVSLDLDDAGS